MARGPLIALPLLLLACRSSSHDAAPPREPDWTPLFDGASLAGWNVTPYGGGGTVEVVDGKLLLGQGSPMTGVTWSGGLAADGASAAASEIPRDHYELEVVASRRLGTDFFCGLTFPVGDDCLTLVLGGWGGGLCGLSCLDGFDAASNETKCFRRFERGRDYRILVRVESGRVQAWLDGEPLVDVDTRGRPLSLRTEVEPCRPLGVATYATLGAITSLSWRPTVRRKRERRRAPSGRPLRRA